MSIKTIVLITLVIIAVVGLPIGFILTAVGLDLVGVMFIIVGWLSLLICIAVFGICHILGLVHQGNNPRNSEELA